MDYETIGTAVLSAVVVVLINRLSLSRKEKHEISAAQAATSRSLLTERQKSFREFETALRELRTVRDTGDAAVVEPRYWNVRTAANVYFDQLDMIASFVRRGDIDRTSAEQDHFDELRKAAEKAIPAYYSFMHDLAAEYGFPDSENLADGDICRNLRLLMSERLSYEEYHQLKRDWGIAEGE